MKVHIVELKELQDFQAEQKVLFASSSKEQKKLYCTLRGSYEIWHYGVLVLETMQPYSAIERYNSLEQFDCYEIWRPNIPDDGCKTQCKECAEKQKQSNCH